jgi:hypothetical protein
VLRLARENPRSGYERIVGELSGVGARVSPTTVAKILRQAGVSPAGARAQLSWRDFLRAHADSIIARDFFTVETLVQWANRLVSARCVLLQLVAALNRAICSTFQLLAVRCS